MNSSSKQPVKKRRVDDVQEPLPGPSSQVLPLVAPHLVKRTSKDPNRGLYPKGKTNQPNQSSSPQCPNPSRLRRRAPLHPSCDSPSFVKASELLHQKASLCSKKEKSECPETASGSTNATKESNKQSSDTNKSTDSLSVPEDSTIRNKTSFRTFKRKLRANLIHSATSNKITRYFKNSPQQQTAKAKVHSKPAGLRQSVEKAGFSGWKKKDETISEALTEINNEQFFKQYRDCYGLVDNSVSEEGEDYFSNLPTHIIETILCQIPMLDLMACRLVCTRWRDIIDNDEFMKWKKSYYKFKKECMKPISSRKQQMHGLLSSFGYKSLDNGITALVKYMVRGFNRVPSEDMHQLLMSTAKGELANQVFLERFSEFRDKEARVWCQFALAILISETVWEIYNLYVSLFTWASACSRPDVIDAMYCVATFLLYFRIQEGINNGLHYRLYYALYMIENHIPKFQREKLKIIQGLHGQQSMHNYSQSNHSYLTYEQIRVLNHQFDMNQKIRIIALAGTGKTTTLLHLSRLYPQIKFLNIVFNKSVNEEAKKKFPPNVTCKTAHSLAYAAVGKLYRHKLTTTLRPYDLVGHLNHNEDHIQIFSYANMVLTTINNFIVSKATEMNITHVPMGDATHNSLSNANRDFIDFGIPFDELNKLTNAGNNSVRILLDAFKIWQKMQDRDDPFKITHDVYLKMYHLRKPNFDRYQCIMVDEAQDCNPVILDIVLSQNMPVIFVGDPNQQIYGFRGAQNALQSIEATHTYHLTKSFRFGPEISYIASCVLELLLDSWSPTIVGNTHDSFINGKVSGQYAVIARTNVVLFNEALRIVVFKQLKANEPTVVKAAFAGGISSYGFDQISDIYKLKSTTQGSKSVADKFISRFRSFSDLVTYARHSEDADLLSKIEIVNQHGHEITHFILLLKARCSHPMELANVVFSTAHKAKGLEFDTVYLTDDYQVTRSPGNFHQNLFLAEPSYDEANILYVALTRAKKCLVLPEKFMKFLHLAYEKFQYPVSSKNVLGGRISLNCVHCNEEFAPHTVLLFKRYKIVMASEREIKEGPLCMKCGSDPQYRPDIHINGLVMYLDPIKDNCHRFMSSIVGPLPTDPPIVHADKYAEFQHGDRIFVINVNIH